MQGKTLLKYSGHVGRTVNRWMGPRLRASLLFPPNVHVPGYIPSLCLISSTVKWGEQHPTA